VGSKAFFAFGHKLGRVGMGWSIACFLQALSVVNRGIAMGHGHGDDKIASNFFGLIARYVSLAIKSSTAGVCAMGAVVVALFTLVEMVRVLAVTEEDDAKQKTK